MHCSSNFKRDLHKKLKKRKIKTGILFAFAFPITTVFSMAAGAYLGILICSSIFPSEEVNYLASQFIVKPVTATSTDSLEIIDVSSGVLREVTAYNSLPEQTDDTPCLAADGSDICLRFLLGECLIAGNFAKFESKHYIDGIGECTLVDRMSSKYPDRVDLYMGYDLEAAKNFGRKKLLIKS